MKTAFAHLSDDLRAQYLLGYYAPKRGHDTSFRTIDVSLTDPALRGRVSVRSRTGYYGGRGGKPAFTLHAGKVVGRLDLATMSFYDPSQFKFATPAAAIAREAGALLRRYYEKGVTAEFKSEVDIVTGGRPREREADHRAAGNGVSGARNVSARKARASGWGAEYRWYVDPLDGTTNFAHGFPYFCVSLGLEHRTPELRGRRGWRDCGGGDL